VFGSRIALKSEALSVARSVFDHLPGMDRSIDDLSHPDERKAALLLIWEPHVRTGRMAEGGHHAGALGDAMGMDDVGWVAVHVAAPGGEVGLASNLPASSKTLSS
jgi:hypothetical protein